MWPCKLNGSTFEKETNKTHNTSFKYKEKIYIPSGDNMYSLSDPLTSCPKKQKGLSSFRALFYLVESSVVLKA